MSRFYVPPENIDAKHNRLTITGDEAHHVIDVMRMKERDKVVSFDGTGVEYTGFIERIDARRRIVTVEVIKTARPSPGKFPCVVLAQAIPKKEKMDYIVEKATELGVSRIIPIVTERTIPRPAEGERAGKTERWERLATAAAKQCGRSDVPDVSRPVLFSDIPPMIENYDRVIVAHLGEDTVPLKKALEGFRFGNVLVLIGPEGDFTPEEISLVRANNCRHVSLGRRVLKSDTAALFVLSAISYEFM